MLGGELRVSLAHRDGLRRLQETLRPLGIAFDFHPTISVYLLHFDLQNRDSH